MKTFIDHIADGIERVGIQDLKDQCYVFPSKRAGLYFKDVLLRKFSDRTFWSPKIYSIEDFVMESHGTPLTDEITLVFDLYRAYSKFDRTLPINRFFPWGQVLLSDFDELDRYLADADAVYSNLKDVQDLQVVFGEPEEVKKAIEEFIKIFDHRETVLMNRFIQNWEVIRKTYHAFSQILEEESKTYKGRAFRKFAEDLANKDINLPFTKIIFAGFNALSKSEEVIITSILQKGAGEIYFDTDKMYMEDDKEEAGDFLRHYKKIWQFANVHWIETDFLTSPNEIRFVGATQLVGQAKVSGSVIDELILNNDDLEDTALVLADENLLMPVLHAMPAAVQDVNITMGYPFRNTTLFSFISMVFRLNISRRRKGTEIIYPTEEILGILNNTMVSPIFSFHTRKLSHYLRDNRMRWVTASSIKEQVEDSWLWLAFRPAETGWDLLDQLAEFLVRVHNFLKDNENDDSNREIIYYGLKSLMRFSDNLKKQEFQPEIDFVYRLFQEVFRSLKIPFEGEPFRGMQVMGFLESRALDFKNVIMLGVNETKVPAAQPGQSYLPFAVRKAFELPTFEEHDAIYAYHFKRLLQRTPKAWILYNTEVAVDGSGEKSRFILQLKHKHDQNKNARPNEGGIKLEQKIIRNPIGDFGGHSTVIKIEKSPEVIDLIHSRWDANKSKEPKPLTPTGLITYIDCKLRFYLKYVARVPEEEIVMEEIDPRIFGNIVHKTIEAIYKPHLGKELNRKQIKELSDDDLISQDLKRVLEEEKITTRGEQLKGKDILVASVVRKLIKKIIDLDIRAAPLTLMGIEELVSKVMELKGGESVTFGGIVDRIDKIETGGAPILRVIDYKTGKIDVVPDSRAMIEDPDQYLDIYFKEGKYKAGFQAYYYSWLVSLEYPDSQIKTGIFSTRKINDGVRFLRKGEVISPRILTRFKEKARDLAGEIFDPAIPFDQTRDLSKCRICAYKNICGR